MYGTRRRRRWWHGPSIIRDLPHLCERNRLGSIREYRVTFPRHHRRSTPPGPQHSRRHRHTNFDSAAVICNKKYSCYNEQSNRGVPMKSFNDSHPELQPGEIFLTNARSWEWDEIPYRSKRKGHVAYDIHGTKVPASEMAFPVFIAAAELHTAAKDLRTHNQ